MENVTTDQVKTAIQERGIKRWKLRECSMCRAPLCYGFESDHVTYDSNCECVPYRTPPQIRGYDAIAETLNMQKPETRARMWDEMLQTGAATASA